MRTNDSYYLEIIKLSILEGKYLKQYKYMQVMCIRYEYLIYNCKKKNSL